MTEYTWPEAARNDKAFGERVVEQKKLRLVDVIDLIELNLDLAWNARDPYVREQGRKLVESYSQVFYERTGHYYTREARKH